MLRRSAADKIVTLRNELRTHKAKYPTATLDHVRGSATQVKREVWGAV